MKKTIRTALAGLLVVPALALGVTTLVSDGAYAQNLNDAISSDTTQGDGVPTTLTGNNGVITTIINVLLFIVGIVSVIMIIIGGIRYAVSGGDSGAVTSAKNTILYAVIGLIVAIFAYAIINWVITEIV